MKIACTGTSGSGKTTLVKFIAKEKGLTHISGSAGDIKTPEDKDILFKEFNHAPHSGHLDVIKRSAIDVNFGVMVQHMNQERRAELIRNNDNFITDRSPLDNLTYFINQVGFHKEVTDGDVGQFALECLYAWNELTHVIFIKPVQPRYVEDNGSRINNLWYQKAINAQFEFWLFNYFHIPVFGPKLLVIDVWDWEIRKRRVLDFLK